MSASKKLVVIAVGAGNSDSRMLNLFMSKIKNESVPVRGIPESVVYVDSYPDPIKLEPETDASAMNRQQRRRAKRNK
jgi:hypothetical protein